jgi:hypothetical protein
MIYHNLQSYLNALDKWRNTTFLIEHEWVLLNGLKITPGEFYATNPRPRYEVKLLQNPDGRQIASGVKTRK